MNRAERESFNVRAVENKKRARHANVSIAEGKVHTGRGEVFYIRGVAQKKRRTRTP